MPSWRRAGAAEAGETARPPRQVKASEETILKSRGGQLPLRRRLFSLRQALATYRHYLKQIAECDQEIECLMAGLTSQCQPAPPPVVVPVKRGRGRPKGSNTADAQLRRELHRIFGTDLTLIPGIDVATVQTILSEVGPDLSAFRSGPAFVSWLHLCPDNRISGGKVLSTKTRPTKNRLTQALRMAAPSWSIVSPPLGDHHRRLRARRLGPPDAVTATAPRLARIVPHLITTRQAYDDSIFTQLEKQSQQRAENRLKSQARARGFQLVPLEAEYSVP